MMQIAPADIPDLMALAALRVKARAAAVPADPAWTPQPGKQALAYASPADELFYGGAAGGGKSDLLLGLAGTAHTRSLILRRIFPSVRGLIERSREIYNRAGAAHGKDSYNESLHLWRLGDGRLIEFGSLQYDKDTQDYRGRPYDFYGFDEITEFTEYQYRFLTAWNRTTRPDQRTRIVATGNPPTAAQGEWVIRYWGPWLDSAHPNPAAPGELRWFARVDDEDQEVPDGAPFVQAGETIYPRSRTFIPARLSDNPLLEATGYRATLQGLPEPLRAQLLYGDFTVGTTDDPWQVIPTAWVRAAQARWTPVPPPGPLDVLGVDVARGGKDRTVLAPRYGAWIGPLQEYPGTATPDGNAVAALIVGAVDPATAVHLDVIGVGTSAYDQTRDALGSARVAPVNFGAGTTERTSNDLLGFANVRAWAYWTLREALRPDAPDPLALPPDAGLLADLCAPRYSVRLSKILVEPKDELSKRIGRSPDKGDAVALACVPIQSPEPGTVDPDVVDTLEAW